MKSNQIDSQRIPQDKDERERVRRCVQAYTAEQQLTAPLSLAELKHHTGLILEASGIDEQYRDFATVMVGNAVWRDVMASVPYHRRVLLLPQCMRRRGECPAQMDEFGLLCEQCGKCPTGGIQSEAEQLGYVVLIAEGTTVVTQLIATGQVDAVVGVSCLSALERSFPHMTAAAIPGIAIPLYKEGCENTLADLDWIRESIRLASNEVWGGHIDLDGLRKQVGAWFTPESLSEILDLEATRTEAIAGEWVATDGKRWRPFLTAAVYRALKGVKAGLPDMVKKPAVAVECFHKASLAHDDIEDNDAIRYGQPTLHKTHGISVALNSGDLLVGEGYRLIAESGAPAPDMARMLASAAHGHRELCIGQGEELNWTNDPAPLPPEKVLEIFRRKTSPAFETALVLGAVAAGADDMILAVLKDYSRALGIAYQIRDDIEDFQETGDSDDVKAMRPSLLVSMALEKTDCVGGPADPAEMIRDIVAEYDMEETAWTMYEQYKQEALNALRPLQHYSLKSLLFRIVSKVLGDRPAAAVRKPAASREAETVPARPAARFPEEERSVPIHAM